MAMVWTEWERMGRKNEERRKEISIKVIWDNDWF